MQQIQIQLILSQCNDGGLILRDYEHFRRFTGMIHLDVGHAGRSNNSTFSRRLKQTGKRFDGIALSFAEPTITRNPVAVLQPRWHMAGFVKQ
jgi:hypothetical protein